MITKNIFNDNLSTKFYTSLDSPSQYIKPKILIDFLDSRHCLNKSIITNDNHVNTNQGDLGYYFSPDQIFNGNRRQSFTWAVADALDNNGKVIRADGNWYAMPSNKEENLEFGWISKTKSTSNLSNLYDGYSFASTITITATFSPRKCNNVTVVVPEFSGQVDTYRLIIRSSDTNLPNPLYQEVARIQDGEYSYNHYIPDSLGNDLINSVEVEILTTKNPLDYARISSINVIYQEDLADYVLSYTDDRVRDLHETSLPIAGSSSGSLQIELDNTEKKFNLFSSSSDFGPFMKKDLKIQAGSGWKIHDHPDQYVESSLRSPITSSSQNVSVYDNTNFPDGGASNYFVLEVDYDTANREYILYSSKSGNYDLVIEQRGYNNSQVKNHSVNALVRYETFEYPYLSEYYVDEWSSSSSSMVTSVSCIDWSKYLSERVLTGGFFVEKSTVPEACESLVLNANFPKGDVKSLNRFNKSAKKLGAILHYDFNESSVDRSGDDVIVSNGLRSRFFAMPSDSISKVGDITADGLDRELSQLEKALGETSFISPDFVSNSVAISDSNGQQYALNLADQSVAVTGFSFNRKDGTQCSEYFNAVYDGFYIPIDSGEQFIVIDIANGGVRVFIEDTLILNSWRINSVSAGQYFTVESEPIYLQAGHPYKIRIESFHATGDYAIKLKASYGIFSPEIVFDSDTRTIAAIDKIGSRNPSFNPSATDRNKNQNYAIFFGSPEIGIEGGILSDSENKHCSLSNGAYIRLPYHVSWDFANSSSNNYIDGSWSLETYVKTPTLFSGDGEYISCWEDDTPSSGFEFFNKSGSNGFKIVSSSGVLTVDSSDALPVDNFNHIVVTFNNSLLKYYVNGALKDSVVVNSNILPFTGKDLTFGGRGAFFDDDDDVESPPATTRSFSIDEFLIYPKSLTEQQVKDRYTETQMEELTIYPFLYGGELSIREVIDEISLADLGRFYIDESNIAKYEHYYRLWEPTIDQHANSQMSLSDENFIISADFSVQLQANRVVIKVSGISSNLTGVQPLWRADDPTTLAVVGLSANLSSSSDFMYVNSTDDPPFSKAGYLVIDNEIVKYSNKTSNQFLNLERGQFNTEAAIHNTSASVREVRYWDLKFDKAPAFQVRNPFITGIRFETPDQISILRYVPSAYGAELVIAASNNVPKGEVVFAEGTNPLTDRVAFTSIAGIPVLISEQNSQVKEQSAEIGDSIALYGVKEVVIENKFITDFTHAQKIADFIIEKNSDPVPVLNLQSVPLPQIAIGDRIVISQMDSFDIINGEYWVVGKSYSYGDSPNQTMTLRRVS